MVERIVRRSHVAIPVIALVAVLLAGVAATGAGLYLVDRFNSDLRSGLVQGCEDNGNPLRETVRSLLLERIQNAESPLVDELFSEIPRALIDAQIAADRKRLREVAPVDCDTLYP